MVIVSTIAASKRLFHFILISCETGEDFYINQGGLAHGTTPVEEIDCISIPLMSCGLELEKKK